MRYKDFLDTFIFIGLCILTVSFFTLSLEGGAYEYFYQNILLYPNTFFYWGLVLAFFTIVYGLSLYAASRGSFLMLRMKGGKAQMDQKMLEDLINCVTKKSFSHLHIKNQVEIQEDETLEITAETDPIDFNRHKLILEKLEKEISHELSQTLSYKKPFTFNLKMR